ncbi:MAG: hypothetical protein CME60_13480 [Halobacteriovoraceae bacterium]|nr:hypothetical protein [Halobacteriovoraceae bacterium]|tara:strand:+ start:55538 stop:56176 length:639 start_codon:yes stop_codon:yes gene_type:complete
MKLSLRTPVILLGLFSLASCTSHLRRNPSSVASCNLYIENLEHTLKLSEEHKSDFLAAAKKKEWNMIFDKHELREGDYVVSGLIEGHLQKKLSFRSNYVYFVPYNLKIEKSYSPEMSDKVAEVSFDHKYELKSLELSPSYGLKGRSIASHNFKKSYAVGDKSNPFNAQFDQQYFDLGNIEGGSLTSSKWSNSDQMAHFFKDFMTELPSCSDI